MICTPSGEELTIYGERTRVGSTFCFVARARRHIQPGYVGYLSYVVDTIEDKKPRSLMFW